MGALVGGNAALLPPYAGTDPRVVLDYGVGAANPWSLNNTTLNAVYGFSINGSVISYDPVKGLLLTGGSYLQSTTALPGGPTAQGSIILQYQRNALSEVNVSGLPQFQDNQSSNPIAGQTGNVFQCNDTGATSNIFQWGLNQTGAKNQTGQLLALNFNGGGQQSNLNTAYHNNSHAPGPSPYVDPFYETLIFTWYGGAWYIIRDGQMITTGGTGLGNVNFASGPAAAIWSHMYIGNVPNCYIKRIQVTNTFTPLPMSGPLLAIMGDSFVERFSGIGDPGAFTVAGWNAVQNWNSIGKRQNAGTGYQNYFGQTIPCAVIQSIYAALTGCTLPIYVAAKSGFGWAHNLVAGNNPSEFVTAMGDAVITNSPEILWIVLSVNDLGAGVSQPTTYGADILQKVQYLTAGKAGGANWANGVTQYPKRLRQIIITECFSWENIAFYIGNTALPATRLANWNSVLAAFAGISSVNGVPVTLIPTCTNVSSGTVGWLNDPNYHTFFDTQDNPNVNLVDAAAYTVGANHPCATGYIKHVAAVTPYLFNYLTQRPLRSVY